MGQYQFFIDTTSYECGIFCGILEYGDVDNIAIFFL